MDKNHFMPNCPSKIASMETTLCDSNVNVTNIGDSGAINYVDLLPTELWKLIFFNTGEVESARLSCCCKKFKNYINDVEMNCRAKCKEEDLGCPLARLKLSLDWPELYYIDQVLSETGSRARFSWKTLYKSWLDYIHEIRSTDYLPAHFCAEILNRADDQRRFTSLKLPKDKSKYIYLGTTGSYDDGAEIVIYQLGAEESFNYYLGYSSRNLTQLLIAAFSNLLTFADLCTKELLSLPGLDIAFIKHVFMHKFEQTVKARARSRSVAKTATIRQKRIKCTVIGCKQTAGLRCVDGECGTHCSCDKHKKRKHRPNK